MEGIGNTADDGFSSRPEGGSQRPPYGIAALVKGIAINGGLRLVLEHLRAYGMYPLFETRH